MEARQITFNGNEYLLLGEKDGAIATKEQLENGTCSFAHLHPDGNISRFGKIIGTIDDLIFGDIVEFELKEEASGNIIVGLFDLYTIDIGRSILALSNDKRHLQGKR